MERAFDGQPMGACARSPVYHCTVLKRSTLLCLESMLESEQDETLPEALRTQALTALTHNFVLCLCKQLNFLFLICSNKTVTEKGFKAWDSLLGKGDLI